MTVFAFAAKIVLIKDIFKKRCDRISILQFTGYFMCF